MQAVYFCLLSLQESVYDLNYTICFFKINVNFEIYHPSDIIEA